MKRVLIVDDASVIRLRIKNALVEGGFEIAGEAADGKKAVAMYEQLKPDVVTMDIVMPGMNGVDALKEILRINPDARVIMITALDQKDKLMEAVLAGAKDYIVKPFEDERIVSAVNRSLATA